MGADEWADWLAFHAHYDLPDGFLIAGQLGAVVVEAIGGRAKPADFAPYYEAPPAKPDLRPALDFLRLHAKRPDLERAKAADRSAAKPVR